MEGARRRVTLSRMKTSTRKPALGKLVLALGLSASLLGLADAATATTTANANLRRTPSLNGPVLRTVPQNTLLTVACTGEWCRTTYQGRGGYIARSLMRPVSKSVSLLAPAPQRPYYTSCAALRAARGAPIRAGQPGYRLGLDSNRNNVACDQGDR